MTAGKKVLFSILVLLIGFIVFGIVAVSIPNESGALVDVLVGLVTIAIVARIWKRSNHKASSSTIKTQRNEKNSQVPDQIALSLSTLTRREAENAAEIARRAYLQVKRPEAIEGEYSALFPDWESEQIKTFTRTMLGKYSSLKTQNQALQHGYQWYTWSTSNDGDRVRPSHRIMHDVICRWDDPPNPEKLLGEKTNGKGYHPGWADDCRCLALPVMFVQDIKFPTKIYTRGKIIEIGTAKEFEKRYSLKK